MYTIAAPIQENDTGPQVANLQTALYFLADEDAGSFNNPLELNPPKDQLRSEAPLGFCKGATVIIVQQFKVQSGLGYKGIVEEKTAEH